MTDLEKLNNDRLFEIEPDWFFESWSKIPLNLVLLIAQSPDKTYWKYESPGGNLTVALKSKDSNRIDFYIAIEKK